VIQKICQRFNLNQNKICLLFLDIQADKLLYLSSFPSLGYCPKIVAALDLLPNLRCILMPVS
jgi:hypothetical protein